MTTDEINETLDKCKFKNIGPVLAAYDDSILLRNMAKRAIDYGDLLFAIRFLAIAKHIEETQ